MASTERKRAFDECPECGATMDEAWRECGDYDDLCDCDVAWDCPSCGREWWDPCRAHNLPPDCPPDRIMVPERRALHANSFAGACSIAS